MPQPEAFGTADGEPDGPISERLVAALLWDLHDAPEADDDPVALGDALLFAPLFETLPGPWIDRGAPGIDLIDYLDALWCADPPAAAVDVIESREVPYRPACRAKSDGALDASALGDGRYALRATVGGKLILSDGTTQTVDAGEVVVWAPPAGAMAGAVLEHDGERAVRTLFGPTPRPAPIERRAGAWHQSPSH